MQRGRKGPPPRPADVVFRTRQGREAQAWKLRREDRDAGAGEEEEPDRDASAEERPGDGESAEEKPGDGKSAEEKPGDGESAEEKPGEDEARLCVWSHRRQAKDDAILERNARASRRRCATCTRACGQGPHQALREGAGAADQGAPLQVARQYEIAVRPGQKKKGKHGWRRR